MEMVPGGKKQFCNPSYDEKYTHKTNRGSRRAVGRWCSNGPQVMIQRGVSQHSAKECFQFDSTILVERYDTIETHQKERPHNQGQSAEQNVLGKPRHFEHKLYISNGIASRTLTIDFKLPISRVTG